MDEAVNVELSDATTTVVEWSCPAQGKSWVELVPAHVEDHTAAADVATLSGRVTDEDDEDAW
jgi:hypothetical protein